MPIYNKVCRFLVPSFYAHGAKITKGADREQQISDPKVNQPKQARRPRMRIQRAHDRALAMAMAPPWPTGRGRMPEGPRSAMARAHGVFSEMPSRNRALGDGGAGLVHGPAWVRSLTVCL